MSTRVAAVRSDVVVDAADQGLSPSAARSALVRLCAAGFVAYCSYSICRAPLLPLFARELGAGPSLIGFVMGASTLTGVFLKLPAGALSDLFGRRRLLVAGALVFATLPFTYLAVSTLAWLVVLRFLHGSATAIFGPVANALEDNVVLYKVEGGKRTDLPVKGEGRTYGKKSEVPSGQWSTLRVVANGRLFEVYFNGTKLYEVDDATFSKPGKVGVWTKADSITQFDDLTVVTK